MPSPRNSCFCNSQLHGISGFHFGWYCVAATRQRTTAVSAAQVLATSDSSGNIRVCCSHSPTQRRQRPRRRAVALGCHQAIKPKRLIPKLDVMSLLTWRSTSPAKPRAMDFIGTGLPREVGGFQEGLPAAASSCLVFRSVKGASRRTRRLISCLKWQTRVPLTGGR